MTTLAECSHQQLEERRRTQQAIADYFQTPCEYVVGLAARMPLASQWAIEDGQPVNQDGYLFEELLGEFRKLHDATQPRPAEQECHHEEP